ncbi:hypothetical protein Tco_0558330 [Tanacetum coccineum]
MGRDTIQLEGIISTISGEYLLEFTSVYGIPENLNLEVPGLGETIVDFLEGKVGVYTRFFDFANYASLCHNSSLTYSDTTKFISHNYERIFPTDVDWCTSAPRDEMPSVGSYFAADVTLLDTNRAPFQRLPENLLCLVRLSQNYYLEDDMYPTFLYDDDREMDLFSLNRNPNPFKVKTETRPRATHEVPLLTAIARRVIDMEDPTVAFGSLRIPSIVERSLLDFENEDPAPSLAEGARAEEHVQKGLAHEIPPVQTAMTTEAEANVSPKVLRKDHASSPIYSIRRGKSLSAMGLDAGSTFSSPAA